MLADRFHVYTPERRGHGHTPDPGGPLGPEAMAGDTVAFLERVVGRPAWLLGVSDGAMVALATAVRRPDLVERLVRRRAVQPARLFLRRSTRRTRRPTSSTSYGEVSPDGTEHYPVVVEELARAHLEGPMLTAGDLAGVGCRVLVMMADDEEVTPEHAVEFYRALPDGELAIVPGTSHGLLVEKPDLWFTDHPRLPRQRPRPDAGPDPARRTALTARSGGGVAGRARPRGGVGDLLEAGDRALDDRWG